MEDLKHACLRVLTQLEEVVNALDPIDFGRPLPVLGGATIGQHIRHTIEFFTCLSNGLESGIVSYDRRAHDLELEARQDLARLTLQSIRMSVEAPMGDRSLVLEACYREEEVQLINTTYFRELAYNLEHAIHHMAILRIGIREAAGYIRLPEDFGVASSTVRYRQKAECS